MVSVENLKKIFQIAENLEYEVNHYSSIGLYDGLTGASLFFFLLHRLTNDSTFEDLANTTLDNALNKLTSSKTKSFSYMYGIPGIFSTIFYLIKEHYLEIENPDMFEEVDNMIIYEINKKQIIDYSFQYGIVGMCNYFIQNQSLRMNEAIESTLNHLINEFRISRDSTISIDKRFLFPSEVFNDIKIFLQQVLKYRIFTDKINILSSRIEDFKKTNIILQSNCQDYTFLQNIRETNNNTTMDSIQVIADNINNKILKGLLYIYIEKPSKNSFLDLL